MSTGDLLDLLSAFLIGSEDPLNSTHTLATFRTEAGRANFRATFVRDFLSVCHGEPVDSLAMLIEGLFSNLDDPEPTPLDVVILDLWFIAATIEITTQGDRPPDQRRFLRIINHAPMYMVEALLPASDFSMDVGGTVQN